MQSSGSEWVAREQLLMPASPLVERDPEVGIVCVWCGRSPATPSRGIGVFDAASRPASEAARDN